jgi:hypothetical protein
VLTHVAGAFLSGLRTVARAPLLVLGVAALTLAAAVPFGLVLASGLQAALAHQPPISRDFGDIDPEWWLEFRHHAEGLDATFTPTVIGFAAPLDNLSALLDGSPRPLVLALPVVLYGLLWVFLWGGVLERFAAAEDRAPPPGFWRSARRHAPCFAAISLAAGAVSLLLFVTVHAWMFGPLFERLAAGAGGEREAFFWRLALYAAFGALLALVGLVADYSRVSVVVAGTGSAVEALRTGLRFVARHLPAVVLLWLLAGLLFVTLLSLYGATEAYGGARVGGWRAVVIGQGYIVGRLAIRLTAAAAAVNLFRRLAAGQPASTMPV